MNRFRNKDKLMQAALLVLSAIVMLPLSIGVEAQKKTSQRKASSAVPTRSSSELKKQERATQSEIKVTKQKITANEKSVSQGLADLSRIDADIKVTQKKVSDLSTQVGALDKKISILSSQIAKNEADLRKLRADYLTAVKRMRLSRGKNSKLSFIFSSKNFSQALRRIRYLRQFDAWREKQTAQIRRKNDELKRQNQQLAAAKKDKGKALGEQRVAQNTLKTQFARQDALVAQLKVQGDQLRAHLAQKQAEANQLKNSIAAVIAAEQARAEQRRKAEEQRLAERKRQQELAQKAEAERKAKAEADRLARVEAEKAKAQKNADMASANTPKPAVAKKKEDKSAKAKQRSKPEAKQTAQKTPKQQSSKKKVEKNPPKDNKGDGRSYADARRRTPRSAPATSKGGSASSASTKSESKNYSPAKPTVSSGGFESAKGSLPRPVNGAFRITSPFGRHSLPDLPGVTYDNPGIDAEVSAGASAQAVYAGKVSGIYRLPGFNTVVIVSHGNYYTVYGNLATTAVKSGDNVKQGQTLGKVADSDDGGRPSIHFEVWRNRDKLNPSEWIR